MTVAFTSTVDGKSYGFDYEDQRIDVDATVDTMLVTNLYEAIKEAQSDVDGIPYGQIASGGGTDVLGTGVETFLTVTLLDNWEVNTLKGSGKFEVSGGNLIRDDQADPFRDNPSITYISFLSQAGIATQIETGVSGLTAAESTILASLITEARYKALTYNKEITGRDGDGNISEYEVNSGEVTVTVTRDGDSKVQSEAIAP